MLEKMKVLGFVPESRAIKLLKETNVYGERYDKVTYLIEKMDFELEGNLPVYVEAEKFLALLPMIKKATATENYLAVTLKNGADYKLPYLEVEFEKPEINDYYKETLIEGRIELEVLKKTALQNLVKPEMRCIYVDQKGAVSCNFLQGTVSTVLKAKEPALLPPDLTDYIEDGNGIIISDGYKLFYSNDKFIAISPVADFEEVGEGEVPWYENIYNQVMQEKDGDFIAIQSGMMDAIKRLSFFGKEISFYKDKMLSGEAYEPVNIPTANGSVFDFEEISSVMSYGKEILFAEGKAVLKADGVYIIVSEKEEE